jgi:hypothetical protein
MPLVPSTKKQWILDLMWVGDCQPLQNIIITILYHEHFLHGTSTFNGNSVIITQQYQLLLILVKMQIYLLYVGTWLEY